MVLSTLGCSIKFFVLQCYQSSPPRLDCHVYLNSKYLSSPRRICLIVVCRHSTLYLMIHALIVVKFDWHMSPLTFALTLKIPVPDTRWYTLSFSNLMSYIFLVISVLDDKIHPVTFVLKWRFNIHLTPSSCLSTYPFVTSYTPILVAYACSIILTSTPRRKLHTSNGLPTTEPTPWPPRHEEIAVEWVADNRQRLWVYNMVILCREY